VCASGSFPRTREDIELRANPSWNPQYKGSKVESAFPKKGVYEMALSTVMAK
jgi:hypothetical protein